MKSGFEQSDSKFTILTRKVIRIEKTVQSMQAASRRPNTEPVEPDADNEKNEPSVEDGRAEEKAAKDAAVSEKDATPKKDESSGEEEEEEADIGEKIGDNSTEKAATPKQRKAPARKQQVLSPCGSDNGVDPDLVFVKEYTPTKAEEVEEAQRMALKQQATIDIARANVQRQRQLAASQVSPFIGDSTVKGIIPNKPRLGYGYDPNEPVDKDRLARLKKDFKGIFGPTKFKLHIPLMWWHELVTQTEWLADTHMDAVMNMFRHRMKLHPEWFRSDRLCFCDSTPSMLWQKDKWKRFLSTKPDGQGLGRWVPGGATDLFEGKAPRFCQTLKKWEVDIDEIYMPWNVKDAHWVALMVSIPKRHITVWDSIPGCLSERLLAKAIEPVAVLMPYLQRLMADIGDRYKYPLDRYTHEYISGGDVPAQDNSSDCGVYCLKFIEYHSLGRLFPKTLCGRNMKAIRAKLAADLYHEINCRGPPERNWEDLDNDI
ncbi:unnamed protein product [Microthlaspi erraticum]|uniref:Ubiquitin-like protease family profile domain-containing protein n=1 Tax=Microthlaspi erraticum TaxID=1685480 RepID=A0A6D2I2M6_9BRAS|nr:unnamed protein product [Microthlaspi erraticum]